MTTLTDTGWDLQYDLRWAGTVSLVVLFLVVLFLGDYLSGFGLFLGLPGGDYHGLRADVVIRVLLIHHECGVLFLCNAHVVARIGLLHYVTRTWVE